MATKKDSNNAGSQGWMFASIALGALLLLSLVWNVVFTLMVFTGNVGVTTGQVAGDTAAPSAAAPSQPAAPSAPSVEVSADDDPVKGDPDAPVTIIEFSDYECPFCGRFYSDALQQIEANYIETGQVKFVYRDFPLSFHPRAMPAAIAAECVFDLSDDETYFEFHDLVFENQGALGDSDLRSYASQVGVDLGSWDTCYADEDGSVEDEVTADFRDGQAAGVSGTPTVFINGQKIVGAQPYAVFEAAIEAELGN